MRRGMGGELGIRVVQRDWEGMYDILAFSV